MYKRQVSYSLVSRREMYRLHEIMRYTKAKIKLMTIPNVAEITNVRIQQTLNGILDVLSHQKLDTYEPVSYTHLDVYKRQPP